MTVPQAIREALPGTYTAGLLGNSLPVEPVERGQIRRLAEGPQAGEPVERLALVLRVDEIRDFAEILFVHPYAELATGTDLVVPSEHSRIPYQVVAQTDVRGVVWLTQVGARVGLLDRTALKAVGAVALGEDTASESLVAGPPLRGRFDRRWNFKAAEGSALRTLAADCTATLLDGRALVQLDVGILSPVLLAALDDIESPLLKLLDILRTRDVVFDLDDLKMLDEIGALSEAVWASAFGSFGVDYYDYYEAFLDLLKEGALSKGRIAVDARQEPDSAQVAGRKPEAGELRTRPSVPLMSANFVYTSDRDMSVSPVDELDLELIDA